jgi:hypothetical protein
MAKTSTYGRGGEGLGCVSPIGGASTKPEIISGGGGHPVQRKPIVQAQREQARQAQKPTGKYR